MVLKKKLAAIACTAALALALPTLAWADEGGAAPDSSEASATPAASSEITPGYALQGSGVGVTLESFSGSVSNLSFAQAKPSNAPDAHFCFRIGGNATNIELSLFAKSLEEQPAIIYAQYEDGTYDRINIAFDRRGYSNSFPDPITVKGPGLFAVAMYTPDSSGNQNGGQGSPTTYQPGQTFGGEGVKGTLTLGEFDGIITNVSAPEGVVAATVPADAQQLCTFEVNGDATDVNLSFFVGADYAGKTVTVFIEHNNGDIERQVKTVADDGTVAVHVDRLSVFTVVLGDFGNTADTADSTSAVKKIDTTAKSPKTNADLGGIASLSALMALAAGAAFIGLRKVAAK